MSKSTKKKRKDSSSDGDHANLPSLNRGQCYGPGCTQISRNSSKYCSDKCGIGLARSRIFHVRVYILIIILIASYIMYYFRYYHRDSKNGVYHHVLLKKQIQRI